MSKDGSKDKYRIVRKTTKVWTQQTELEFIQYDFPVECAIRGYDFLKALAGYEKGLSLRTIPFHESFNREELIRMVEKVRNNPPTVWNLGEMKTGERDSDWAIKYYGRPIITYTTSLPEIYTKKKKEKENNVKSSD